MRSCSWAASRRSAFSSRLGWCWFWSREHFACVRLQASAYYKGRVSGSSFLAPPGKHVRFWEPPSFVLDPISYPSALSLLQPSCFSYLNPPSIIPGALFPLFLLLGALPSPPSGSPYQKTSDWALSVKWQPTPIILYFLIMMIFPLRT